VPLDTLKDGTGENGVVHPNVLVKLCEYGCPITAGGKPEFVISRPLPLAATEITKVCEVDAPKLSVTVTMKLYAPVVVGVPLIIPVVAFKESPAGNPPFDDQL
jgi:hypothetical protein